MTDDVQYRTPGHLISALLEERGWSQKLLATILEVDDGTVAKMISGRRSVDAALSITLGEVFGIEPERFLHLQKLYELAQARLTVLPGRRTESRARLFGQFPVSEMLKRGWLEVDDPRDETKIEAAMLRFFGVTDLDSISAGPHAAKKTDAAAPANAAQSAWLHRVRQIASEMLVTRYSSAGMRGCLGALQALLPAAEATRKVPRILAEHGIRLVIVETVAKAKIDGACLWLSDDAPVVGMSLRHDRVDNFWFVLRHEIEHVLRGDGKQSPVLDVELEGENAFEEGTLPEAERAANKAAAEFCVPSSALAKFIARKSPFFAERDILGFAKTVGVHPGLVAGQLQHATGRYDRFRAHLVKVRTSVAPSAIVDGWGDVAPVGL